MVGHEDGIHFARNNLTPGVVDESPRFWPFGRRRRLMAPKDKLKSIGLAMYGYNDTFSQFPGLAEAYLRPTGLSWRVHLLPFLEEKELFDQFNLDEPWDSPHNIKLMDLMPEVFHLAGTEKNKTVLHVFVGENTPFEGKRVLKMSDMKEGTSNIIMFVVGTPQSATEWTKPGGLTFNPATPFGNLASADGGHPVVMFDGSLQLLTPQATAEDVADLIDPRDGRFVNGSARKPWN